MLIYFLVEDSQGNFSVSPPEKAFPARLLKHRDSGHNSWDSNLSAKMGPIYLIFRESPCAGRLPQHPHPCF